VENFRSDDLSILPSRAFRRLESQPFSREADLPAQRAQTEEEARLPGAHGYTRGPRDPQAAARQGSEAALRLSDRVGPVQRRHRLSRSRDFDTVYRHGRSVSTRYLVLYWFPREEADVRMGLAVPKDVGTAVVRNRIKRQLREAWRSRLERIPSGRDYVLKVRPGLAEAAENQGFEWLGERIEEVLGKAAA
jgi:ribonuclease P protein component